MKRPLRHIYCIVHKTGGGINDAVEDYFFFIHICFFVYVIIILCGAPLRTEQRRETTTGKQPMEPLMMLLFLFGFEVNAKLFRIFNAMKMEEGCALSVCVCKE